MLEKYKRVHGTSSNCLTMGMENAEYWQWMEGILYLVTCNL